jgi:hypothetical protein
MPKSTLLENILVFLGAAVGFLLVGAAIALFISIPVWLLWNWLVPVIFGLTKITLLQALGLVMLSGILFKTPNFKSSK